MCAAAMSLARAPGIDAVASVGLKGAGVLGEGHAEFAGDVHRAGGGVEVGSGEVGDGVIGMG